MDKVQGGAEANIAVYEGRIIRAGTIYDPPLGLVIGNPSALVDQFNIAPFGDLMPALGDRFPDPNFQDYFLKRYIVRPQTAKILTMLFVYEWHGLLTVMDTSTLSNTDTQLLQDGTPLYVQWKNPLDTNGKTIKRVATYNTTIPLRHVIARQTIDHAASESVLQAFGTVNKYPWYGLPIGYWLFSGIEGISDDNGITYTYTATFTTKQIEDWKQIQYLKDDHGVAVIADPLQTAYAKTHDYQYGIINYVAGSPFNGISVVGLKKMTDFSSVFAFGG